MEIVVKGRHTEVTERFRLHAAEKLGKLERLDSRVMSIDVEVIHEANPRLADHCERVELTCRSRGPAIRAEAAADDVYAALDLAFGKLEERLRRAADRRRVHHGARTPMSVATALSADPRPGDSRPAGPRSAGPRSGDGAESSESPGSPGSGRSTGTVMGPAEPASGPTPERLRVDGDGPLLVREKSHRSTPMALDQALHEMELVGHDFFLFWDADFDAPSVVYRRRGYSYGVIRLDR